MNTGINREYAVPYTSVSKGTSMAINDEVKFNDFHLCAAINKQRRHLVECGVSQHEADVFEALCREAGYRDLNPAYKGGKASDDPRIAVPAGGDEVLDERHPEDEGYA